VDFQENSARVCHVNRQAPLVDGIPPIECQDATLDKGDAILAEISAFIRAVNNGTRPLVSGEDGLRALNAAIAIGKKLK